MFGALIGESAAMREVFSQLEKIAASDATVLIEGETGTGKEGAAEAIHDAGARAARPFVVLDCSAIPANLLESELFGHEAGAFTGAVERRIGAFEQASTGTLFLDEIGESPGRQLQPKLLRALESREIRRVGGHDPVRCDLRIIAATNRDLRAEVNRGTFRADLYYRLAVVRIALPPLRERVGDIPVLAAHLLARIGASPAIVAGSARAATSKHWRPRTGRATFASSATTSKSAPCSASDGSRTCRRRRARRPASMPRCRTRSRAARRSTSSSART